MILKEFTQEPPVRYLREADYLRLCWKCSSSLQIVFFFFRSQHCINPGCLNFWEKYEVHSGCITKGRIGINPLPTKMGGIERAPARPGVEAVLQSTKPGESVPTGDKDNVL